MDYYNRVKLHDNLLRGAEMLRGENKQKSRAFVELCAIYAKHSRGQETLDAMRRSTNPLVEKAATAAETIGSSEIWGDESAATLAAAYIQSIAEESLLDLILAGGARNLPHNLRRVLIASASTANPVDEGALKPVKSPGLIVDPEAIQSKAASMTIFSKELLDGGGDAVMALFDAEIRKTVNRAVNETVIQALVDSNTQTAANLAGAMELAGPSDSYVVAMPSGQVASLAVTNAGTGPATLGVRGGMLCPGVHLVAIDDASDTVVIPASRLAVRDFGLRVVGASHATVEMRDDPVGTADAVMTSLWQSNLYGLLAERSFILGGDTSGVVVIEGES